MTSWRFCFARKIVSVVLSITLAIVVFDITAFAAATPPRVANVNWYVEGTTVILSYDLEGDPEETYDVSIVLRRANDVAFEFVPTNVTGNIGEGQFVGKKNEIRWQYKLDMPREIGGSDFYFEVEASRHGGTPWGLLAGGVVVGGAIVFLLSSSPADGNITTSAKLPFPPRRP